MYAIIDIGGTQYKVEKGNTLNVNRLDAKKGSNVTIDKVLLVGNDSETTVGQPYITNAKAECLVVSNLKGEKVIAYKWRRRKGYHRKVGHRQPLTKLQVKEIKI